MKPDTGKSEVASEERLSWMPLIRIWTVSHCGKTMQRFVTNGEEKLKGQPANFARQMAVKTVCVYKCTGICMFSI